LIANELVVHESDPGYPMPNKLNTAASAALVVAVAVVAAGCVQSLPTRVAPDRVAVAEADARRAITTERITATDTLPPRSLGITPLRVHATDTTLNPLGYGLADMLMTDLSKSAQVQIVDRLRFDAVLREMKLATAGLVETGTAPRVGRIVRARRLILGDITQLPGRQVTVNARVADVRSTQVRPAISATTRLDDIFRAEKELAYRMFAELGITLTPAERAAVEQRPTSNLAALLAYSRGVRYEVFGRFDEAAREFQTAASLDPEFVEASLRARDARHRVRLTEPIVPTGITGFTLARVNAPVGYTSTRFGGGVAEVTFPSQTVTVLITITTRP
jgi:TolB-like protein